MSENPVAFVDYFVRKRPGNLKSDRLRADRDCPFTTKAKDLRTASTASESAGAVLSRHRPWAICFPAYCDQLREYQRDPGNQNHVAERIGPQRESIQALEQRVPAGILHPLQKHVGQHDGPGDHE